MLPQTTIALYSNAVRVDTKQIICMAKNIVYESGSESLHGQAAVARVDAIEFTGYWEGEILDRRKSGELFVALLTVTAVEDGGGQHTKYVASFADISQRVAAEGELRDLAFYDPLTGLANRRLLHDRMTVAMAKSDRENTCGAVLFMDLDHFKTLNDKYGHTCGDNLLVKVAERLRTQVRKSDTVARFGGDEFVILFEHLGNNASAAKIAALALGRACRHAISAPYKLDVPGLPDWQITVSIGISLFHGESQAADAVLDAADKALYAAKRAGRNAVRCSPLPATADLR